MKGLRALIVSFFLALIAAILVAAYLQRQREELLDIAQEINVVKAKVPILELTRLDESMLTVEKVPMKYVQPRALTRIEDAIGKVTVVPILQDEQILPTKLETFGMETGLALKVPAGARGLTLFVNDVTGVAGLIRPGNYVDVYATFKLRAKDMEESYTRLVMQNLLVLAVERKMGAVTPEDLERAEREREQAEGLPGAQAVGEVREEYPVNLTVSVTPEQAAQLITAQDAGLLTIALRSQYEVEGAVEVEPVRATEMLGKTQQTIAQPRRPQWREIRGTEEVYRY